jgi:hypothetical protein
MPYIRKRLRCTTEPADCIAYNRVSTFCIQNYIPRTQPTSVSIIIIIIIKNKLLNIPILRVSIPQFPSLRLRQPRNTMVPLPARSLVVFPSDIQY